MITWLRSLITFLGFIIIGVVITPIMLLFSLPFWGRPFHAIVRVWCKMNLGWLRIAAGVKYRVLGEENLQHLEKKPHLLLSNHQSTFETYLYSILLPPHSFVLKKQLLYIPFFGWGLAKTKPISIDREAGRAALKKMVSQAQERFQIDRSVIIFPEGTRANPDQKVPYKKGAFIVAKELNAPILPLAINSGRAWPKGSFLKYPGTITLTIGKPIMTEGRKIGEIATETETWIRSHTYPSLDPALKPQALEAKSEE